ncbi:uncharacterized protein LOC21411222 isoform X2 [Morus notabilis]|uniref:uncharacterized protein LOC21411222 isoform X2 n=1 Tax=Morus notabilis TaxID=981085 RepID=UPI000CECEBCE|nr:uncharacterized protein LOC21411222 isoform X2 [Morus notabilis]
MASTSMIVTSSRAIKKLFPHLYSFTSSSGACFSTAYERAEGSNAVKEVREGGEGGGTSGLSYTPEESIKEGLYKAKHQGLSMPNDVARDGLVKAGLVGETAKETLDGQWKAAQETSRKVKDEAAGNNRRQVTDHYEAGPNINDDHDRDRDRDTSS